MVGYAHEYMWRYILDRDGGKIFSSNFYDLYKNAPDPQISNELLTKIAKDNKTSLKKPEGKMHYSDGCVYNSERTNYIPVSEKWILIMSASLLQERINSIIETYLNRFGAELKSLDTETDHMTALKYFSSNGSEHHKKRAVAIKVLQDNPDRLVKSELKKELSLLYFTFNDILNVFLTSIRYFNGLEISIHETIEFLLKKSDRFKFGVIDSIMAVIPDFGSIANTLRLKDAVPELVLGNKFDELQINIPGVMRMKQFGERSIGRCPASNFSLPNETMSTDNQSLIEFMLLEYQRFIILFCDLIKNSEDLSFLQSEHSEKIQTLAAELLKF